MYVSKDVKRLGGISYRSYISSTPGNMENIKKDLAGWGIGPDAYRITLAHYPSGETAVGFWVRVSRWPRQWPTEVWIED
jgi:hypothetical protein